MKTRTFFAIDVVIALALIVAGGSAIAFLIPYDAIDFATSSAAPTFLGLAYGTWQTLHLYAGLVMIVGGLLHLALHWGWMTRVAKSMLPGAERRRAERALPADRTPQAERIAAPAKSVARASVAPQEVPDVR